MTPLEDGFARLLEFMERLAQANPGVALFVLVLALGLLLMFVGEMTKGKL
jgi:hypothetical protein